ncbi:hypothetical protein PUR33_00320, partial [Streptomyces sp. BE282]|uniref:hypothetical protein n=1 Tax=Streptomyces sp. BE282 TaxID=3002527 RepID=UPI002E78C5B3
EECVSHLTSRPASRITEEHTSLVHSRYECENDVFGEKTVAAGSSWVEPRTPASTELAADESIREMHMRQEISLVHVRPSAKVPQGFADDPCRVLLSRSEVRRVGKEC